MSENSIPEMAEALVEQFEDVDAEIDVDAAEIESDLQVLIGEYSVQAEEAQRTVRNRILDEAGLDTEDILSTPSNQQVLVDDIDTAEEWVDLKVQVADLWDDTHESMAQAGLLGDESGTIKFIAWESSDLPALQEGASYRLGGVVTDEYEGRYSVKLVSTTEIGRLDETVEVGDSETVASGALVDIKSGSGLIKRCTVEEDCTRVLQNGRCAEHGECDGEFDMRIKGVLDDGADAQDVLMDAEAIEGLTGVDLEEAQEMAMDALDTSVVGQRFEEELIGRYFEVSGPQYGQYLLANEIEQVVGYEEQAAEDMLIEGRSEVVDVANAADELGEGESESEGSGEDEEFDEKAEEETAPEAAV